MNQSPLTKRQANHPLGTWTISWTTLRRGTKLKAVLEPAQQLLDPAFAIVAEAGVEAPDELRGRYAPPVPVVEELVLEPAEEALARDVVGAAALGRHAPVRHRTRGRASPF